MCNANGIRIARMNERVLKCNALHDDNQCWVGLLIQLFRKLCVAVRSKRALTCKVSKECTCIVQLHGDACKAITAQYAINVEVESTPKKAETLSNAFWEREYDWTQCIDCDHFALAFGAALLA